MKLLWVLVSGVAVNASFAAGVGANRKGHGEFTFIEVVPLGGFVVQSSENKAAQEAPPPYITPTSKMSRGSDALPPCTPLSVTIPENSTIEMVTVSVPPTPAPKPDRKNAAEFVDLRNGSTALVHVVAAAAAERNNHAADLGPVSTKLCLSNLTDQELETEITRAQAWHRKWSQEYYDFEAKINAEQQKIMQARNDQALNVSAIHVAITAASGEIDRLNKLFIEHKKARFPYWSAAHLEWVKKIREHNSSKAHLSCLERWCESKPACFFSYCNCSRKEICTVSCMYLGSIAAVGALFTPLFLMAHEKQK